jgi:hypothetical protein
MDQAVDQAADAGTTLADTFQLRPFVQSLMDDLKALRAGEISVPDAYARAQLARQVLRGVSLAVTAQKFIEGRLLGKPGSGTAEPDPAASAEGEVIPPGRRNRRRR